MNHPAPHSVLHGTYDGGRQAPQRSVGIVAIDDDPLTLHALRGHLGNAGYQVSTASNGADGIEQIDERTRVALVDLRMPGMSGMECLRQIREHHPDVQVIILTASNQVHDAVDAMRAGAFQFVTKPFDPHQLIAYVEKAVAAWNVSKENEDLKATHYQQIPVSLVSHKSEFYERLMHQVDRLASLEGTVFIGGESGTGKSTIARMIHQKSKRSQAPFVTVNCASLPRDLIQSELFGHTKGAFTGALNDRIGHAEVADGGTLFLDEIGDLPLDLQPKLLTFLQERTVQRLGATSTKKVDVRLIVATHRDLARMCRDGLFREDLYFRLMVLCLELPSLTHRLAELPGISQGIIQRICSRDKLPQKSLSSSALASLTRHSWPGNIRELENVLERAIAFSQSSEIDAEDLVIGAHSVVRHYQTNAPERMTDIGLGTSVATSAPHHPNDYSTVRPNESRSLPVSELAYPQLPVEQQLHDLHEHGQQHASVSHPLAANVGAKSASHLTQQAPATDRSDDFPLGHQPVDEPHSQSSAHPSLAGMTLKQIEREAIVQTLKACNGNKARSARSLGISEKSIYNKMRRLEIDACDYR